MEMFEKNSDEGVSPVVGVILMVAITVILSAIIATFVLDLGGTVSQNPQAGVTFDQHPEASEDATDTDTTDLAVTVQVVSMENADYLTASTSASSAFYDSGFTDAADSDSTSHDLNSVGGSGTIGDLSNNDKVTVTATLEGKTQVIQTYTVDA